MDIDQKCCFGGQSESGTYEGCQEAAKYTLVEKEHPHEPTYACVTHVGPLCRKSGETLVFAGG